MPDHENSHRPGTVSDTIIGIPNFYTLSKGTIYILYERIRLRLQLCRNTGAISDPVCGLRINKVNIEIVLLSWTFSSIMFLVGMTGLEPATT